MNQRLPAAIVDLDGTLVDTNYQHTLAWYQAFRRFGIVVPLWRTHRHIGMGGDQIVTALCGESTERDRGHAVVLASSAKAEEVEHYLDLLDARELVDGWTTSGDVERTKPHPDLVAAGIEKAGADDAVMIGDSTWDIEAARRVRIETIAVLTGGYSAAELREAGAVAVFESLEALHAELDGTPLARLR